ncbi:MAG: hypothetical protein JWO33_1532, partial [Caulobacteraceae bacterium]|nr:hypothetical protein [Caulobacteraceae bacterium]
MSKKHLKTVLLGAVAASAYLQGGLAHAQTARPAAPVADVGEVVVTARRREESLQSVPLSVTALSQDSLKAAGIVSATDLTFHVPGINLTTMASSSNTNFSIRGQTRAAVGAGLPAVVVYFNDVPEQANGSVFNPFDVQSVQVLKGPQGTLFGRNTIGGAILINTQPAGYEFGGYAQVTGGDYNRFDKEGAVNIPIVQDHLALRLA